MRPCDFYIPTGRVKLQRPASGYVRRADRMENGSLMLLHGCSGVGKTLYLAELAEIWENPVVYLALSEEDNDSEMLTAHFCRALDVSGAASFHGAEDAAPRLLQQALREIYEKKCTLLIDHVDAVTSAASVRIMEALL